MRLAPELGTLWMLTTVVCLSGLAAVPLATRDRDVLLPTGRNPTQEPKQDHSDAVSLIAIPGSALFRANRGPPSVRYDAAAFAQPPHAGMERPSWHLSGVVIGDVPLAVFEDQSGEGAATYIVTVGDDLGGYVVVAVGGDSAVVESGSQRWTFAVEAPWE